MTNGSNKLWHEDGGDPWYMAGTEGTGKYVVPAANCARARVGYRILGNAVRVRVEPVSQEAAEALAKKFPAKDGWKQPDVWQFRFSHVFTNGDDAIKAIERAIKALGRIGRKRQPGQRLWRKPLREVKPALPVFLIGSGDSDEEPDGEVVVSESHQDEPTVKAAGDDPASEPEEDQEASAA